MNELSAPTPLRTRAALGRMVHYVHWLQARRGLHFDDEHSLWRWSSEHRNEFRSSILDYFDVHVHVHQPVKAGADVRSSTWSPLPRGTGLNIAEQVFRWHLGDHGERAAVIGISDTRPTSRLSWNELRRQVASVAHALRALGVGQGDRVAAALPDIPEAVVAFCACASVGAVWSVFPPDTAAEAFADHLRRLAPKLLFAVNDHHRDQPQQGRRVPTGDLRALLPGVQQIVYLNSSLPTRLPAGTLERQALLDDNFPMTFEPVPPEKPLWIAHSCDDGGELAASVHGHGDLLLDLLKSGGLALDLGEEDRFMWFNMPGSGMRSLQFAGLLVGATICLHDSRHDDADLAATWRLVAGQRLTVFGATGAFFRSCMEADIELPHAGNLSALRLVACTDRQFPAHASEWMAAQVGPGVTLSTTATGGAV